MNQLLDRINKKYNKVNIGDDIKTNKELIRSIIAVETSHRNIVWRFFEYIVFIFMSYNFCVSRILTIGKLQVKVAFIGKSTKCKSIKLANDYHFLDNLFYNTFSDYNWKLLSDDEINDIVLFYNGDKTGEYSKYIKENLTKVST